MDAVKFTLGQTVYLKLNSEKSGMITGILFRPQGHNYLVTWASDMAERYHYDIELTEEKEFNTSES